MQVELFDSAQKYRQWLNGHHMVIEVHSVVVFDNYLVVTYRIE